MVKMNYFCRMVGRLNALFLAWTIVRDTHLRKSPTRREQDLQLLKTRVQTYTTALQILDIEAFKINENVDTKWVKSFINSFFLSNDLRILQRTLRTIKSD